MNTNKKGIKYLSISDRTKYFEQNGESLEKEKFGTYFCEFLTAIAKL